MLHSQYNIIHDFWNVIIGPRMLSVHAQKPQEAGVFGQHKVKSCVRYKESYLKWLTASKRSQQYLKRTCEKRCVPLHNKRVGELSELAKKADSLQLPVLQPPEDEVFGCILVQGPKVLRWACFTQTFDHSCQWVDVEPCRSICVKMTCLVIYLMDACNWKDDAVITNIQADFPEGDTVSGLGAS